MYYIAFGLLGLMVNNTFNTLLMSMLTISGILNIIVITYCEDDTYLLSILCACVGYSMHQSLSEFIKMHYRDRNINDRPLGIHIAKVHRFFVAISSLVILGLTMAVIIYQSLGRTIALVSLNYAIFAIGTVKTTTPKTYIFVRTRVLFWKITYAFFLVIAGLSTSNIQVDPNWVWAKLLVGWPIVSITMPYMLFNQAQLTLATRGKYLKRNIGFSGTRSSFLCIVYYYG